MVSRSRGYGISTSSRSRTSPRRGAVQRAQLRIGWLIDTVVTFDDGVADELIEADTIFDMLAKTRAIRRRPDRSAPARAGKLPDGTNWDEVI